MSNKELSNEFDILYNSISSLGAPGLDEYEKSVFLTKAQLQLVKEYNGSLNKYKDSFEGSDKRRTDLKELVVPYEVEPTKYNEGLSVDSYTAKLPDDLFLIKYEAGIITEEGCDDTQVSIKPIKHDEYHEQRKNPFRKVSKKGGLRLDIQSNSSGKVVELILSEPIDTYKIRYVKYPTPIVLVDLGSISSEALSVDGISEKTECTLDEELHPEILDRAVELALIAYKPDLASLQIQANQRNN